MSSERLRPPGVGIGSPWGCPKPLMGRFRRFARPRRPGRPLPNDPFMRTHEGYHYPLLPHTSRPLQVDPRPWAGVSGRVTWELSYSAIPDVISGSSSPRTSPGQGGPYAAYTRVGQDRLKYGDLRPFLPVPRHVRGSLVPVGCTQAASDPMSPNLVSPARSFQRASAEGFCFYCVGRPDTRVGQSSSWCVPWRPDPRL